MFAPSLVGARVCAYVYDYDSIPEYEAFWLSAYKYVHNKRIILSGGVRESVLLCESFDVAQHFESRMVIVLNDWKRYRALAYNKIIRSQALATQRWTAKKKWHDEPISLIIKKLECVPILFSLWTLIDISGWAICEIYILTRFSDIPCMLAMVRGTQRNQREW